MTAIRRQAISGLRPGDSWTVCRTFTQKDGRRFAALCRDENPVHHEPGPARARGLSGPVCHQVLVASLLAEIGGQLGWLASGMSFRFLKPTYIGDTVTCRLTILEVDERNFAKAEAVLKNQEGEIVLTGDLQGFLPNSEEQARLAKLLDR